MKIRLVGAELFHADGQTDMKKLIVAFRNFVNAPKSESEQVRHCVMKSSSEPRFNVTLVDRPLVMPVARKPYRRERCIHT